MTHLSFAVSSLALMFLSLKMLKMKRNLELGRMRNVQAWLWFIKMFQVRFCSLFNCTICFLLLGCLEFIVDFTDTEHYKKSHFFIVFFCGFYWICKMQMKKTDYFIRSSLAKFKFIFYIVIFDSFPGPVWSKLSKLTTSVQVPSKLLLPEGAL